jgi:hypothetical protein
MNVLLYSNVSAASPGTVDDEFVPLLEATQTASLPGDRATSLIALAVCCWSLIVAPLELVLYPDLRWLLQGLLFRIGLLMTGAIAINRVRAFYRVFAIVCALSGLACGLWAALDTSLPAAIARISIVDCSLNVAAALAVCGICNRMQRSGAATVDDQPSNLISML